MGRRCCITGCNSTSRLPEHHGVTYHSFPLDNNIRSIWIRNTHLNSERQITKSVLVCSRHFRRADFQPQRSGKYLLKQRVFPTVFPWGKVDAAQVEADLQQLKTSNVTSAAQSPTASTSAAATEDVTKATVEATVAQIMAQTAELNAAAGIKPSTSATAAADGEAAAGDVVGAATPPAGIKFEPVTTFNPGARLEAQDFDGVWHIARVVEVDNDDREVLIKFERTGKIKSAVVGTEEWIPMNSTRLRQKISTKPVLVFELEEKCMARWSGPRKFPGTVKKILSNDSYEVLFDDGYVKNVRAIHMNKVLSADAEAVPTTPTVSAAPAAKSPVVASAGSALTTTASESIVAETATKTLETTPIVAKALKRESPTSSSSSSAKKRAAPGPRKDWPLLDLSKLDLTTLDLPEIPRDGEWTCHWVNDQPIGRDGFLFVGEHRKPTVIVEDWRLPPGWVKHMYQRSNVLGKWDVILVTPNGKRFRSKADLKSHLEEQGQVYNPDIYDFSIHRRRAKDINAYVYTSDYTPQQPVKPKSTLDTSLGTATAEDAASTLDATEAAAAAVLASSLAANSSSQFIETPVATPVPPMELMTPTGNATSATESTVKAEGSSASGTPTREAGPAIEQGFAFIGGLKVLIVDNLFRCPQEGCSKNFRKENHLQIHIKHYHAGLIKLLGACPKMQELAEKRTHTTTSEQTEPHPKNQIPNQQFFAKLHQQDIQQQQSRAQRRSHATSTPAGSGPAPDIKTDTADIKSESIEMESLNVTGSTNDENMSLHTTAADSTIMEQSLSTADESSLLADTSGSGIPIKRSRFSLSKRTPGSRKSNRQRTTRRYLTAAQATAAPALPPVVTADSSFGVSEFEETRHSFNATPDAPKVLTDAKKRRTAVAPANSISSLDSPVTADSGSSSFQPLQPPSSNEAEPTGVVVQPQYIKENGEIIKIVRMRQEEIINCLCSYGEEDGLMIQCELCLCWQHGGCNGIDKESDVPDKYVCYICRNPQRARESLRFRHDQDWLYEGKLPVANYHIPNPSLLQRFDVLKKSHTLTGNLIELKQFMHSLRVKINIANNRVHPKLYLWAKKWDDDALLQQSKVDLKLEQDVKMELDDKSLISVNNSAASSPIKKIKSEPTTPARPVPNIPQPEAPIDTVECQHRLLDHIKVQQNLVMNRLSEIEGEIDVLEEQDTLPDLKESDMSTTKDVLTTFIKELEIMKQLAKLNSLEHVKQAMKNQLAVK